MSSLSLAGWAPAVTEAGEVRCPSLPPSWLSPKFLLQWQFFDHMGTFYKETIPPKMGFSPLEGGQESCSLHLISGTRVFLSSVRWSFPSRGMWPSCPGRKK